MNRTEGPYIVRNAGTALHVEDSRRHLTVVTMWVGLPNARQHVEALVAKLNSEASEDSGDKSVKS